jgi:hypothetical protein
MQWRERTKELLELTQFELEVIAEALELVGPPEPASLGDAILDHLDRARRRLTVVSALFLMLSLPTTNDAVERMVAAAAQEVADC